MSALAALRSNITVVTLYANLGEKGILYGLNDSEVNIVEYRLVALWNRCEPVERFSPLIAEIGRGGLSPTRPLNLEIRLFQIVNGLDFDPDLSRV